MGAALIDVEFSKYWSLLTPVQKQSLLGVVKSFIEENEVMDIAAYNQELQEAEKEYETGNYISQDEMLKLIRQW